MKYLISLTANALALFITANIVPGIEILNFQALLIATIIVALINTFIRPLLRLISLPITFITFGLFTIVINALTFSLAAFFAPGFEINGLIAAFTGAVVLSIANIIIDYFINKINKK